MDKLKLLFEKSSLNINQQNELLEVLCSLLPEIELSELYEFLSTNPEWVEKLYVNYKSKKNISNSRDPKKWQEVFGQDKSELEKL